MTDEDGDELRRLRGRAGYHAARRGRAAVAAQIGIGEATLGAFLRGRSPGPRTRARLRAWLAADAASWTPAPRVSAGEDATFKVLAVDILLEDVPPREKWVGRAEIVRVVLREHARNGVPAPPHLLRMLAEAEGAVREGGACPPPSSGS